MQFKSLKSDAEVKQLDEFLRTASYVDGFVPSSADAVTFGLLNAAPKSFPNALRWYNHIASFSKEERAQWGGSTSNGASGGGGDDDEDIDLFGESDDEDNEEKERIKQERLKAYAEKKSKKPGPIAKSNVIFDVKPWDDETDLLALEKEVRTIAMDGLIWAKLIPVAFGIKKLQIGCVLEDEKVSTDLLEEKITDFEDYVQSVDIAAFNKI